MAEDEYNKKLESLQQYIPFLNNMIVQLKDPRKKNREQQLTKMVSLHSMITDKKKKLKLETLIKCEDVILKLYEKVKSGVNAQPPVPKLEPVASTPLSPALTPSSPSPPRDIPKTIPVVIPTEKIPERCGSSNSNVCPSPSTYKTKIDIYSSAADSLNIPHGLPKTSVFDRLGEKAPDMSKPPISLEDLEALQEDDSSVEKLSLNELTDLREKLQRQLKSNDDTESPKPQINTTVRNTTILTKKAVEKISPVCDTKKMEPKISMKPFTINKPVKVIKEAASIFGSTLSSIDNQILGSKQRDKEKERRSSTGSKKESSDGDSSSEKKKEHRSSKDEKRTETGHKSSKDKTEKRSEHRSKERKDDKKTSNIKESKKLDKTKSEHSRYKEEHKDEVMDIKESNSKEEVRVKEEKTNVDKPETPVYKRLADKYNPKPRKPNPDAAELKKEEAMEKPSIKVSPLQPPQLPPFNLPLLSPTGSSNSGDSDMSACNKRLPHHPPHLTPNIQQTPSYMSGPMNNLQPIPSHVGNILTNPNTSPNLINVCNQFNTRPVMQMNPNFPQVYNGPPIPNQQGFNFRNQGPRFWGNQTPRPEFYPPAHGPRPPNPPMPNFDGGQRFRSDVNTEWRRFSWSRDNRDPRVQRGGFREEVRTPVQPPRRESKESERDSRSRFRDPRLNRREEPNRSRSRSRETDDGNTFTSPLDSLYSNSDGYRVTGKGYGVQSFKIPKIRKEEEPEEFEIEDTNQECAESVQTKTEESLASVSSSSECDKDQQMKTKTETQDSAEITSTNDLQNLQMTEEPTPNDSPNAIYQKILKTIEENRDNPNLTNELRKVVLETAKEQDTRELLKQRRLNKAKMRAKRLAKQKELLRRKMLAKKKQKQKTGLSKREETDTSSTTSKVEDDEDVIVSVGERIKSRKRAATIKSTKKRRGKRGELDMLHEDIHDMFIRDGVLTATGKRLCRAPKGEESKATTPPMPETRTTRRTKSVSEKIDVPVSPDKLKAMSNVRVLLPKMSIEKLEVDEEGQRYSLRRATKSNKSYVEPDSDEDKEKEEEEVEEEKKEESESESEVVVEKVLSETPKRVKKRGNMWASGIIPKRKKKDPGIVDEEKIEKDVDVVEEEKTVSNVDDKDEEKSFEFVEPDKNYYSSGPWHVKAQCKLCDFYGRSITQHYRFKHPESEILSSRLKPEKAEEAIKESLEFNLDETEDRVMCTTKLYYFKCRFCDKDIHGRPANLYDHISTHTGEYRHICTLCSFSSCNIKPTRAHYTKVHGRDRDYKLSNINTRIYGYICLDCNFVQMNRKTVENHVNVYHLGEGKKISKIHMSSTDYKWDLPKQRIRKKIKPIEDDDDQEKDEEKSTEKQLEEPVVKKEKEIDMTVFTCNTDIHEDNEEIERERLKTMTELNESVKTNRQSLNFVDQLSNRLLQEQETTVVVKNEPLDVEFAEPILEVAPKMSLKIPEQPMAATSSTEVVQKDNVGMENVIQKLRGILKEEQQQQQPQEEPPPLAPLPEKSEEDRMLLGAGFLNILRNEDGFEYVCRVPSCIFTTTSRDLFLNHWSEDHVRINQSYKATKCRICQMEVSATENSTLLNNFFTHVESEHLEQRKLVRTRRLSGDKLSSSKEDVVVEQEEQEEEEEEEENPFGFKISGVMSLAEEEVPPLSPIKEKSPKVESIVLKESKMTNSDKTIVWKCPDAMKKFVKCPRELYKCPQFFCNYCTNWRHLFESHIKAHMCSDELLPCVYCDVKTPLSHAGLHIDLRHFNCLYSCSVCLYRASCKEYVVLHMKQKHKDNNVIILLPPKVGKSVVMNKTKKYQVKESCPAFVCGHKDCGLEFLYQNDFVKHVEREHQLKMVCGAAGCSYSCLMGNNVMYHWRIHGCYHFHCLLCNWFGSMELYTMMEHYSATHPSSSPIVVDRREAPKGIGWFYTEEAIESLRYVTRELMESVNSKQYHIVTAPESDHSTATSSVTDSVTLVPVTFIQESSEKKLVPILPKPNQRKPPSFMFAAIDETKKDEDEEQLKDVAVVMEETERATIDPLSIESVLVSDSGHESDSTELSEAGDTGILKSFGLVSYQLYRCAFCDISFSNSRDFKTHCMHSKQCREETNTMKPFKCVHCERMFKNPHGLMDHIQYHGPLRFGCSLCVKKFPSSFSLKVHMRNKHNVTNTVTTPVIPNKTNMERDEFVLRPVPVADNESPKDGSTSKKSSELRMAYGPDEVAQIPQRYIFSSNVSCAVCSYSTKVRTNLVRHLQFHSAEKSVPDIAPVNPVPCLDKNEKMFDKMTNLAISSFNSTTGRMGGGSKVEPKVEKEASEIPAYVPTNRRYVCCAPSCNYLCLEESNLRHHLFALHFQEPSFTCTHCKATLKTDVEGFLKHLKLHDVNLYKCSTCSFVHYLRHKVDKHVTDKHPDKSSQTVTVRLLEGEVGETSADQSDTSTTTTTPPNVKWTKPWHCGMCKYRCAAKADIMSHIFNKHDINTQYKCTLCSYKTDEMNTFEGHFKDNHPDNSIDVIHVYYKSDQNGGGNSSSSQKSEKQFDTTPLWQRDRPRVRHIRGILFEESGRSDKGVKKLEPKKATSSTSVSNLDLSIEAVATGSSNLDLAIEAVARGVDSFSRAKRAKNKQGDDSTGVILIEDDEIEENDEEEEVIIEVEAASDGPKVELSKHDLNEETLFNVYGNVNVPSCLKAFKCPKCVTFKTKKVSAFVQHLLMEQKCNRFKCKICCNAYIAYDSFVSHCKIKHDGAVESYLIEIDVEPSLIYWMQLLIKNQAKAMIREFSPTSQETVSQLFKAQCEYCQLWFRNIQLKEHKLVHWAEHSYTCGHCNLKQKTMNELFEHSLAVHQDLQFSVKINGPSVEGVLKSLKTTIKDGGASSTTTTEDSWFGCLFCTEVEKSVELLKKHFKEWHEKEDEKFGFKMVAKPKVEIHACNYCHVRGSEKFLKEHHEEKHKNWKYDIYQYICLECGSTFANNKDIRGHFGKMHVGKKLSYSCVERKESGAIEQYCCTKCPFRSCSVGGIRGHLRKHVKPIDCKTCGGIFTYPTEAREHHKKEHTEEAEKFEDNQSRLAEYEEMVKQIVTARDKGIKPIPRRKMLARKSTGAPFVVRKEVDLRNLTTSIE